MCLVLEFVGETRREKERSSAVHGSVQASSRKLRQPVSLSLLFPMTKMGEEQGEATVDRRQRGRVVRAPDLKSVGRGFKYRSDR